MLLEVTLPTQTVIGFPITALSFEAHIDLITRWARKRSAKAVCVANVHMLMEAHTNPEFAEVLHQADLVTPDGMPLVWVMKWLTRQRQDRVAGMDLLLALCQRLSAENVSVFFLGSEQSTLDRMRRRLHCDFPDLIIAGMKPLPFRPQTVEEDEAILQMVNQSGAGVLFVSLGCPKQEYWINQHKGRIHAVMIGVGGAFPVYAGVQKWAPIWVRQSGLEWLFRLIQEPKRLWRRYYRTIPPFIYLALKQVIQDRRQVPHCSATRLD